MTLRRAGVAAVLWTALGAGHPGRAGEGEGPPVDADVVLRGGTLVDGTGAPARKADVALKGDRVVAVGAFVVGPKAKVVDASGKVVAPGFIDLHSHSDETILRPKTRANYNFQTQGVTTVVTGNCGGGRPDVAKYLGEVDAHGAGTNVAHLVPLGSVRSEVLGNSARRPGPREREAMRGLVARGMEAGAWGVSSGLIYVPGRYATTAELVELTKVAAGYGGIYATHLRDEGAGLLGAIDEALAVGKGSGAAVHVSHLKANGRANWGHAADACARIEDAREAGQRVTADQYPYAASSTTLEAMVVPHWALGGGAEGFARVADDPDRGARLRREVQAELDARDGGAAVRLASYPPQPARVGLDLAEIARREGTSPLAVVLDIQRHGGAQAIDFGLDEKDVRGVMAHEFVATASDASAHRPGGNDRPHPRAYGTFPRKVRYALELGVLSLEQAVRSATGLPAEILGLPDRGVIRPGAAADLVVFDPNQFRDVATYERPTRYAHGVEHLFVNGVAVISAGRPRNVLPGRALRLTRDGPADLVLRLGRVWTGDPARPWAQALAARAGVIVAAGTADEVAPFVGPRTRVVDRPGAFGMPGLVDAHAHLVALGAGGEEVDLRGVKSPEEAARRVKKGADAAPGVGWVTGRNWDQTLWPGGAFPTSAVLDAAAPDRPVWLRRVDGHAGWANTEALRRAGVSRKTDDPEGGKILRNPDGTPSGVLVDAAMTRVDRKIPPPGKEGLERQILGAQKVALDAGLTGVHDAGLSREEVEAFRDLDRAGKLKLRVYGMALPPAGGEVRFVSGSPIDPGPSARFRLRAVKVFVDGALGSRGALLFEPYRDDPKTSGLLLTRRSVLEALTAEALRHGWQVAAHAIGDRANALVLDAYDAARKAVPGARDPRLRVEHAQVVRRADLGRFAGLGVVASMQPSHAADDLRWADLRLGPDRAEGAYAWRWFLDAGVPLAFGSDFPVSDVSPFAGLHAATTRRGPDGKPAGGWHPEQALTLAEALRAYTAVAAYAAFEEDRVGVIRVGMRADLTVVDRDLFRVGPDEILKAKVVLTVVDGEAVGGEDARGPARAPGGEVPGR